MQGPAERTPPAEMLRFVGAGERVVRYFRSDMDLDGRLDSTTSCLVTDGRLLVFDPSFSNGRFVITRADLHAARVRRLYGNIVLEVRAQGPHGRDATSVVLRASYSMLDEVEALCGLLAADAVTGEPAGHRTDRTGEDRPGKCRQCGTQLPRGHDICPRCVDKRRLLARTFAYVLRYRLAFLGGTAVTILLTVVRLAPNMLNGYMIDEVLLPGRAERLVWIVLAILGVHLAANGLNVVHIYVNHWLGNRVVVDLRTEVYRHVQRLTLRYYDKRQTGWIMSRVTNDTNHLQGFMVHQVQEIVVHLLTLAGIAVVLFVLNPQLAAVALIPTPLVAFATARFAGRMHKTYHRIWRRVSQMYAVLGDTIPGIRVVKAFTREGDEVAKFAAKNEEIFDENLRAVRMVSLFYPAMGLTTALGIVSVWGFGGWQALHGQLSVGTLVAFIGFMAQFYGPIQALSRSTDQLQAAVTAAERLFEILDTEAEPVEGTRKLAKVEGAIRFDRVSFYYEKGEPVLEGIDFAIRPGEMIGLVGSSGSGKTTMVNLIARFYEVSEGRITLDGVDLREIDLHELRGNIGMVLQEPFLFHGSIAENIAYGRPGAQFDEIVRAAMMANAHGFVMELPDGYDTRIGERGVGLSGGQKQRISIARAILRDPRILILDEATSAVDTETERQIQEAIDRLVQGRTTIAIAHRLSTLQAADRLIVLQDGKVIETGTHADLLARQDGVFRRMVELQAEVAAPAAAK